jgi:hypothetical protein
MAQATILPVGPHHVVLKAGRLQAIPHLLPPYRMVPCAQDREREKELEMIKAQYLGGEKKKKKVLKGAEKFKFNFDWEAGDDTSRDLNPLYNSTHGTN